MTRVGWLGLLKVAAIVVCGLPLCATGAPAEEVLREILRSERSDAVRAERLYEAAGEQLAGSAERAMLFEECLTYALKSGTLKSLELGTKALDYLVKALPDRADDWAQKRCELLQNRVRTEPTPGARRQTCQALVAALRDLGDRHAAADRWEPAEAAYNEAGRVTLAEHLGPVVDLLALRDLAGHRARAAKTVARKLAQLQLREQIAIREEVIGLLMVDLDRPDRAAELLNETIGVPWRTLVPLAARELGTLGDTEQRELGDEYADLASEADRAIRAPLLRRAKTAYEAYLAKHTDPNDPNTEAVRLSLDAVCRWLPDYKPSVDTLPRDLLTWADTRDKLTGEELGRELQRKFTEVNGGKNVPMEITFGSRGTIEAITIDNVPHLVSITPLAKLRFRSLTLRRCPKLQGLDGVQGGSLGTLEIDSCAALSGDLALLRGMDLRTVRVLRCPRIESLNGLQGMPMEILNCDGLSGIRDLEGIYGCTKIRFLMVPNCRSLRSLDGIDHLDLRVLDISNIGVKMMRSDLLRIQKCFPKLEEFRY